MIDFIYEYAEDFSEGLAPIRRDNKWGYIDRTDKEVIEPRFDMAHRFEDGAAVVKVKGLMGVIDKSGS